MNIDKPNELVYDYTVFFNLGMQINPNSTQVLFIGGGGFSGPKFFLYKYPSVHIDVAEVDPDVIDTAMKYFSLTPSPRLTVFNEDGRLYLTETSKTYDIIILDAYAKSYVPFHLLTREFMKLVAAHVNRSGIVLSNLIGSIDGSTSNLVRAEYRTAGDVMNNSALFETVFSSSSVQNLELAFTHSSKPLAASLAALNPSLASTGLAPMGGYAQHLYQGALRVDDVPLLTDGYAPVETLINPLTGSQYVIEQEFGRLTPTTSSSGLESIAGLLVVGVAWFAHTRTSRDRFSSVTV